MHIQIQPLDLVELQQITELEYDPLSHVLGGATSRTGCDDENATLSPLRFFRF